MFKKRLLRITLLVLLAGLVALLFAPLLVGSGLRFWIWWNARQQNLTVKIDKIETPFLRPVVLHDLRITSVSNAAVRVDVRVDQATVALNLQAIFLRTRERALRNFSANRLRGEIHRNSSGAPFPERSGVTWQKLLPDTADVKQFDLRVENGSTVILLRGGTLSASEIEAGHFSVDEVTIASPLVRQTFSQLRGATRWQDSRLTLAGFTLTRGLDVEWATADLSHLGRDRLGVEFDLDAFGGKIRGDISNEWRSRHSNWNMAGSAADVSLTQTAEAIGFADRVGGLLHAGKFTFRGDLRDPAHSVASLWTELTSPAWHGREADLVMLGVALYNRQIQLQQLYVKQKKNQLTLSGEGSLPSTFSDWLRPDFRGDISAAITDLGEFATLFGANRNDFAGAITVTGTMNARDRKVGGHVTASGAALTVLKTPIDTLSAELNLKADQLELRELKLTRRQDFVRASGKIDIGHDRKPSGSVEFSSRKVQDYFPKSFFAGSLKGNLNFSGRKADLDSLQLVDGAVTTSLNGTLDLADLNNIGITLIPLDRLLDLSGSNAGGCIDHLQITRPPPPKKKKSKQPVFAIEKIDLRGDFVAGPRSIKLTTSSSEKEYRILCPDQANRVLPVGVAPQTPQ
jgi:hypothetical protein